MKRIGLIAIALILIPSMAISNSSKGNDLPPYFSWRDINGVDYITPVKNQAPAPTCEAYALVAVLETKMQYKVGKIYNPDLSEAHLYFYAGGTIKAGYVNIIDAANYLMEHGVPDEGCFPDPHRPYDFPFESLPGWENRTVKIKEWGWVAHDMDSIKKALIEHGPLAICAHLYKDLYYYHGGIYHHRWGRRAGGHVMMLAGYDDYNQCWIVKNSWGTSWGEDGWVRIAYDSLDIAEWYGKGTGIMYLDGIYGNLMPDVPKIYIEKPTIYHTYLFNFEFPTIWRNMPFIQEGAPRIFGAIAIKLNVSNASIVEFYVDGNLMQVDEEQPYEWVYDGKEGLHTIEAYAYDGNGNVSKDIIDAFFI